MAADQRTDHASDVTATITYVGLPSEDKGGSPADNPPTSAPNIVTWPAYLAGQALIAAGVVYGLRHRTVAPISDA